MSTAGNTKSKSHPWRTYGTPMSKQWGTKHKTDEVISLEKVKNTKPCAMESCISYKDCSGMLSPL